MGAGRGRVGSGSGGGRVGVGGARAALHVTTRPPSWRRALCGLRRAVGRSAVGHWRVRHTAAAVGATQAGAALRGLEEPARRRHRARGGRGAGALGWAGLCPWTQCDAALACSCTPAGAQLFVPGQLSAVLLPRGGRAAAVYMFPLVLWLVLYSMRPAVMWRLCVVGLQPISFGAPCAVHCGI